MPTDRPISAVLGDIAGNLQALVRSEFRLAKTEVTQEIGKAASAGILLALGAGALAFSGLFALVAVVHALSTVMPAWAAALIVAVSVGLLAALLVTLGFRKLKAIRTPPRTAETMKENLEWASQLTK